MANNPRNPGENSRGLNSIDNYIIDQFMTLQSPEELQQNLNQSRSIISNFFNNDLFAIRSNYTQKIEDLETKALINAENARYELELKNRKEINDLLSKSLADQAKGYESILNDMRNRVNSTNYSSSSSSSSSSGTSSQVQDSAENMGRNIADAFGRGAQSQNDKTESIGMQLGSKLISSLTGAISKGLDSYLTAVGGKLDIMGSFASGNQMAANFRSEFGRYSYGQNTLKEQANAIKDAYYEMRNDGVIVDPNILVNMYRELGNIVSLTGTSSAKLTSLLNVTTKISESGAGLDTSTISSDYFRNTFGEDMWLQLQGIGKYLQTENSNLTDSLLQQIINDQGLAYQAIRATENITDEDARQAAITKIYEDAIQTMGSIADQSSTSVALNLQEIASSLLDPERELGQFFKENRAFAAAIENNLKEINPEYSIEDVNSATWMAENYDDLLAAMIQGVKDSDFTSDADVMKLSEALGLQNLDPIVFRQIIQDFNGDLSSISSMLSDATSDTVSQGEIDSVFEAQSSGYSIADTLNQQLEMAGFNAVSETYEDQTIGWLALIGNTLLDALGGVGGGLIGGLIQGATSGIVGGLLTGAGGLGGSAGGLIGLLGPAAPWIAGAAAVLGTAYLIVDGIKQGQEESNRLMNEQIDEYTESMGIFSSINEDTGLISMEVTKPEDIPEDAVAVWNPETKTYDWVESELSDEEKTAGMSEEEKEKIRQSEADKTAMSLYKAAASSNWAANAAYKADIKNSSNGYTTLENLYDAYKSGELTAEEFEYALHTGRTDPLALEGQRSTKAYSSFTKWMTHGEFDAISKEENVKKLFELLRSQDPAFAALLDIYDKSGALTQKGNSIFDWDTGTRDFIYNFPDRANLFLDSGQIEFAEGKKYQNASDYVDENSIKKVVDMLSEAYPDRNYDSYKGDEIASDFSLATGLDNIPYDGYPAILHEGEMVIPAKRANTIRALLGQPIRNYSNVPANKLTGDNSFVQSIPEYANGTDYITGPAVSTVFPVFAQRLSKAIEDLIGIPQRMSSGYRSTERQRELYERSDKTGYTAKPGNSMHETGWAADVGEGTNRNTQKQYDKYPYNALTNEQLAPYDIWKPLFGTGSTVTEAWHTEGIETKGLGRGAKAVQALIQRYGLPTNPKDADTTFNIQDASGLDNPSEEQDIGNLPAEYAHLIKYAYIPRVAETLRRLGYNKSTTSGGYGGYTSGVSNQGSWGIPDDSAYTTNKWRTYIDKYAAQYAVPAILMYGLMMTESSGDPNALNKNTNASGLFQFLQKYWHSEDINVLGTDIFDPEGNTAAAAHMLRQGYEKANSWSIAIAGHNLGHYNDRFKNSVEAMKATRDYYSSAVQTALGPLTSYVDKVYNFAGVQPVGAYLAEGGIVTSPTVAMIGEGKNDEAVIPLNEQQDYLGIQSMTINIIDALDIISDRICKKLDQIITLKKQSMNTSNNQRTMVAQRSARAEALRNFQLHY